MAYRDFWSLYEDDTQGMVPIDPEPPDPSVPSPGTPPPNDPMGPGGKLENPPPQGGAGDGGDFPTFGGRSRLNFDVGNAPRFNAPQFRQPTLAEAQNEPGYAFAAQEGRGALEASAAARGTLNTGGTLKDVLAWGNKFGEQNYGNVYNRALSAFDRLYRGELDMYKPLLQEWSTRAQAGQRSAELAWLREMDLYRAQIDRWKHLTPSASDIINLDIGTQ